MADCADRCRASALLLVAILTSACTATPVGDSAAPPTIESQPLATAVVASSSASEPTTFVARADGYTLTVTADPVSVAPGETITFTSTFHNGTMKPIDYAGAPCNGGATAYASVALPVDRAGKTWSGIRQTFKEYVLTNGYGPGGVPALDPVDIDISPPMCEQETFESELGPGESVTSSMAWKAEIVAGLDALAGPVPFKVSVGYDRQNGPPSYPPDYTGVRASWIPIFRELAVKGRLEVVGEGRPLATAGEAIDAALADEKFATWLADLPTQTWSNANLFLTSQSRAEGILPAGPAWELDLFREAGVPRHWAIAFIDPFDATLISVHYCDIPCDR